MNIRKVTKQFHVVIAILLFDLIFSSCGSKDSVDDRIESSSPDCLVGEWSYVSETENLLFVFNSDKSGYEDIGDSEGQRPFTWSLKEENKVVIVYQNETIEWELDIDCESVTLSVFGLNYKKK